MDFKPTLKDVLYTHKQWASKEELHKLLSELETEYRQLDPEFSLSKLRAYILTQDLDGASRLTVNSEIDSDLHHRLISIVNQVFKQK
ncbi:hypothetical protein N008_21830 (plasmid) [Hymenobacter sp. APR13]|nr:hypothetical protein N008_21830 [Hymenobacter sp. APR13]